MDALKVHLKKTLATAGVFLLMFTVYLPVPLLAFFVIVTNLLNILSDYLEGLYWSLRRNPRHHWLFNPIWWLGRRSYFG